MSNDLNELDESKAGINQIKNSLDELDEKKIDPAIQEQIIKLIRSLQFWDGIRTLAIIELYVQSWDLLVDDYDYGGLMFLASLVAEVLSLLTFIMFHRTKNILSCILAVVVNGIAISLKLLHEVLLFLLPGLILWILFDRWRIMHAVRKIKKQLAE